MSLRRIFLTALVLGVLGGALAAVLLPRDAQPPARAATGAAADALDPRPAPVGDLSRPRVEPAVGQPRELSFVQRRLRGRPRIELRQADPLGGPDWAIRTFRADRKAEDHPGRAIGRNHCAQLGRLYRGRFGWVDARNVFRPASIQFTGAPSWCGSRRADLGGEPHFQAFARITDPDRGVARPVQGVAWGIAGAAGQTTLTADGRPLPVPGTPTGAFLAVGDAGLDPRSVRLEVRYPGRPDVRRGGADARHSPVDFRSDLPPENRPARPAAGAAPRLVARVPDPAGGLPWGVEAIRAERGGHCVSSEGRIVGEQLGGVDYILGTFKPRSDFFNGCPTPSRPLTRRKPLAFAYGGGAAEDLLRSGANDGRRARRTLPGRFSITGRAHAAVRSITIATPRDVRTLRPAPGSGAFLAVYDGGFPTGEVVLTSRLEGGAVSTERFEPGF